MATARSPSTSHDRKFAWRDESNTLRSNEMTDIVTRLNAAGAHLVLCNDDKSPCWQRWQLRRPSVAAVLAHKGPVGIIPASVSALVLDVDCVADVDDLVQLFIVCSARFMVPSRRRRGCHIYIADDQPRPNGTFKYLGCSGDIRSATGYVILWNSAAWRALDKHIRTLPTGPLPGIPDAVVPKCSTTRVPYNADLALHDGDLDIPLEHARHSQRNPALFDAVRSWAFQQYRDDDPDLWDARVLAYTQQQNLRLQPPLYDRVLVGMARWVARHYGRRLSSEKSHIQVSSDRDERVATARQNGIKSGTARRQGTPLEFDPQPWIAAGVSRATWYRHRRRQREMHAGEGPKCRPQLRLQAWVRIGINQSAWHERLAKVRSGRIPPRLVTGWDYLGIGTSGCWEYLGLTEDEWKLLYEANSTAPPTPDVTSSEPELSETELKRQCAGQLDGPQAAHPDQLPTTSTPAREAPSDTTSLTDRRASNREQRRLRKLARQTANLQRTAAFEARKTATRNRKAFHRAAKKKTTEYRREQLRKVKELLRLGWLDYLQDCEDERVTEMRRTGIQTVSLIHRPSRLIKYDPNRFIDLRAYAMMMRDVEKANLGRAQQLFRAAQRRGEQPLVPPWEEALQKKVYEEVVVEVDRYGDPYEDALAA